MGWRNLTGKWTFRRDKILLPSIIAFGIYVFFEGLRFSVNIMIFRTMTPHEFGEIMEKLEIIRGPLSILLVILMGFVGSYFSSRREGENSELIASGVIPAAVIGVISSALYILIWMYPVAFYGRSAELVLEQMLPPGLTILLPIIWLSALAAIGVGITIGIKRWKEK